jgi:hypothetical protein
MNKFWSKSGIILGVILAIISIIFSSIAYNDSSIRHPEGWSDLKIIVYPNYLLGLPATYLSSYLVDPMVYSLYKTEFFSSIPDDPNFQNIVNANKKASDNRYQLSLFIELFFVLTLYWFFMGFLIAWVYRKLNKIFRILLIATLIVFILAYFYLALLTFNPSTPRTPLPPSIPKINQN